MVAREPGESDADYELRQRDNRHSQERPTLNNSSDEEEEEEEEEEKSPSGWFSRRLRAEERLIQSPQ